MTTMPAPKLPLTELPAWSKLAVHYQEIKDFHLRTLVAENTERAAQFSTEGVGLFSDYSKHRITEKNLELLICLARSPACRSESTPCLSASGVLGPSQSLDVLLSR